MTNFSLITKYIELQTGIMYDSVADLGFGLLPHSQTDSSHYWNFLATDTLLSSAQIQKVEAKMHQSQRTPAFYFENTDRLSELAVLLKQSRYSQAGEDSWMFYSSQVKVENGVGKVKKVDSNEDLEVYLSTFDACYQKTDPDNPYGELGEYLAAARETWINSHQSDRVEYFIMYKDESPVAVSALTNYEGLGYISNVGSLRSVRGQGFGKSATLCAVNASLDKKNTSTFLLTEDGTNPHRFYTAMGFETKFTARVMVNG